MPRASWKAAPEVEELAEGLIERYHPHLVGVPIRYLFRDKAKITKGSLVWGTAYLKSSFAAYLTREEPTEDFELGPEFFVIEMAYDVWMGLKPDQRLALTDHELCHCWCDDEREVFKIRPHTVEEFTEIAQRHGIHWRDSLASFGSAIIEWNGQRTLALEDPEAPGRTPEDILSEVLLRHLGDPGLIRRIMEDAGRYFVHRTVEEALSGVDTVRQFARSLQEQGVSVEVQLARTGRGHGLTVVDGGVAASA